MSYAICEQCLRASDDRSMPVCDLPKCPSRIRREKAERFLKAARLSSQPKDQS